MNVFIPTKTLRKSAKLGLSESQIMDVFNSGEEFTMKNGSKAMKRKYSGYEIGLVYVRRSNGEYVITAVWKRDRR